MSLTGTTLIGPYHIDGTLNGTKYVNFVTRRPEPVAGRSPTEY